MSVQELVDLFNELEEPYTAGRYDEVREGAARVEELARARLAPDGEDLAAVLDQLGFLYKAIGDTDATLSKLREVIAIRRRTGLTGDEGLRVTLRTLGSLEIQTGNPAEAERAYRELIEITERDVGPRSEEIVPYRIELANVLLQGGSLDEAEELLVAALDIARETEEENLLIGAALATMGLIQERRGDPARALPLLEEALRIHQRLLPETHSDLADAYNNVGLAHVGLGNLREAESLLLRAEQLAAHAEDAGRTHSLILARINLADVYRQVGRYAEAERYATLAVKESKSYFGEQHSHTAGALNVLGLIYQTIGRLDEALPLFETVVQLRRMLTPGASVEEVSAANNLGALRIARGEYDQAIAVLIEAHERAVDGIGHDHPLTAFTLENQSQGYLLRGQPEQGIPLVEQALEIRRRVQGERHPDFAGSLSMLAMLLIEVGRHRDAEPLLLQALSLEREVLGPDHFRYAIGLSNLGLVQEKLGRAERAEELFREALQVATNAVGPNHAFIATVMGNLALLRKDQGDLPGAIELARKSVTVDRAVLGETHHKYAVSLHNLASLLAEQGDFLEAEPLGVQALDIARRALGPWHREYASIVSKHADIQQEMGNYRAAEQLMLEDLEIERRNVGDGHPNVAAVLITLADLQREAGKLPEAAENAARAVNILRAHGRTNQARFAATLSNQALVYMAQGDYTRARENLNESLEIEARLLGEDDPQYGQTLANLGMLAMETGRYTEAAELLQRAIDLMQHVIGKRHPRLAVLLNNLGMVRAFQGQFNEAERLLAESREIKRVTLGESGPDFAMALNNISYIHSETGANASARALLEQALAIERSKLGDTHPLIATALATLAVLYQRQNEYEKAEPLLRESLEMRRRIFGDQHPEIARTLDSLGALHLYRDQLDEAENECREALELFRRSFPADHPDIARCLNNLAVAHQRRGNFAASEEIQREALAMRRRLLGHEHPSLFLPLLNLITIAAAQERYDEALELLLELEAVNDLSIVRTLPGLSEYRCMAWLESLRVSMEAFLALVVQKLADSRHAVGRAFDLVLRRKAIAFEVLALQRATARMTRRGLREQVSELRERRRRLAEESLADPLDGEKAHRTRIAAMETAVEELESQLARAVPALGLEQRLRGADRATIAQALPPGAALVEWIRCDFVDFAAVAPRSSTLPAHYLAFVLPSGSPDDVQVIDLGEAEAIDRKVDAFRKWIASQSESNDPAHDGTRLREAVLDPIVRALPGCERLFIAPDGALHRLPFEALPGRNGGHVLDTHHISYVAAGRDLVPPAASTPARKARPPLVAAAPDFNLGDDHPPADEDESMFEPLEYAMPEGIEVAHALHVPPLLGADVLKRTILRRRRPRILHLATHGFFVEETKSPESAPAPPPPPTPPRAIVDRSREGPGLPLFHTLPENPLLRSGVALAGANTARRGGALPDAAGNGLLLAAEVLDLDLTGTELVVLSGCETGLGDIRAAEGVYGLRRTFLLAGARTVITGLWRVSDVATRRLMVELYQGILAGEPRSEALRNAQKSIRRRDLSRHPYFWAGFVCVGDANVMPPPSR